jgi:glucose/arabinose dehydrogenase
MVALLVPMLAGPVASAAERFQSEHYKLDVVTIAEGLRYPWGLAFLPDGRMLVSERPGRLRIVGADGKVSAALAGAPEVADEGQGGMLDVAVDPAFGNNGWIYFSFSEPGSGGAGTAVARARFNSAQDGLKDVEVIFRQQPKNPGGYHFGSRLVFGRDNSLFITTGDRGQRDRVQDFGINRGQVIRINTDGSIPADNPFVRREGYRPEVWSLGHRNPQGAALHPTTGELWTVEHGARGGDELNKPEAGKNYGWPVISYGRHYSGAKIGVGTKKDGLEQPRYYWDPSIAPSGMAFYTGDQFPKWRGSVLVGALKYQLVARLSLSGDTVVGEERMLQGLDERIRDVRSGPDGYVYLLTDAYDGRILRIEPAQ